MPHVGTPTHGTETITPYGILKVSVDASGAVSHSIVLKCNFSATTSPGTGDDSGDGYAVGSEWWDLTAGIFYKCADASLGAASWKALNS